MALRSSPFKTPYSATPKTHRRGTEAISTPLNDLHMNEDGQFTPTSNTKFLRFASTANKFSDDESDNYDSDASFRGSPMVGNNSDLLHNVSRTNSRSSCSTDVKFGNLTPYPVRLAKAEALMEEKTSAVKFQMTPNLRNLSPVRRRNALTMAPATPYPCTPSTPFPATPATPFTPYVPMMDEDGEDLGEENAMHVAPQNTAHYMFLALVAALFAITSSYVRWGVHQG
jgi:hypothetical protein